eukprot:COSAG02_NODE_1976_length_10205_cov_59.713141_5_plen_90_part_00
MGPLAAVGAGQQWAAPVGATCRKLCGQRAGADYSGCCISEYRRLCLSRERVLAAAAAAAGSATHGCGERHVGRALSVESVASTSCRWSP